MNKENMIRLRRVYGILLCISIFLAGVCLIAGCLSIYYSGDQPYSREAVADTFAKIAVPVWTCLIFTVGGFVWELLSPSGAEKRKTAKAYDMILSRLTQKKDIGACDESFRTSIVNERKSRRIHSIIRTVILCIGCAVFLLYALNPANFDRSDINGSVIKAMYVLLPCLAVPFIYAVFTAYHGEKSIKREIALLKSVPTTEIADNAQAVKDGSAIVVFVLRAVLFIAAVAVIIYGFIAGGTADVLTKAINICTECIGLG